MDCFLHCTTKRKIPYCKNGLNDFAVQHLEIGIRCAYRLVKTLEVKMMTKDAALIQHRYVRVIERREDGFVEFRFSIGYPEYYAELVLSEQDFEVFCKENAVTFLPEGESARSVAEPNGLTWSLRDVAKGRMPR